MRIAIIKTAALGDVLRTTALLPALHRVFREVEITWITSDEAKPLVSHNDLIAIVWTPDEAFRRPTVLAPFEWVISLDEEFAMAKVASSLPCKKLSGAYIDTEGAVRYTDDLAAWFGMGLLRPELQGGLSAANRLKRSNTRTVFEILYHCLGLPEPIERPQLAVPASAVHNAKMLLCEYGILNDCQLVGVNAGAGRRWQYKSLTIDKAAEVCRLLVQQRGTYVLLLGGHSERERNVEIAKKAGNVNVQCASTELSLIDFAALVSCCDVLLTSDSLAMHMGIALAVPTVSVFGPTSAPEIDLFGCGEKVVTSLPCRACYLPTCDVRPHCMETFDAEVIRDAVEKYLRDGSAGVKTHDIAGAFLIERDSSPG